MRSPPPSSLFRLLQIAKYDYVFHYIIEISRLGMKFNTFSISLYFFECVSKSFLIRCNNPSVEMISSAVSAMAVAQLIIVSIPRSLAAASANSLECNAAFASPEVILTHG
jgi:hypothetical protein